MNWGPVCVALSFLLLLYLSTNSDFDPCRRRENLRLGSQPCCLRLPKGRCRRGRRSSGDILPRSPLFLIYSPLTYEFCPRVSLMLRFHLSSTLCFHDSLRLCDSASVCPIFPLDSISLSLWFRYVCCNAISLFPWLLSTWRRYITDELPCWSYLKGPEIGPTITLVPLAVL